MAVQRVVVKVGSSSLTDRTTGNLSTAKLTSLVSQLVDVQTSGLAQVILVTSGAVAVGVDKLGWHRNHLTIPQKQAAAAVGQGLLMDAYERLFRHRGTVMAQMLLTRLDIEDRRRFVHIKNTLFELLRAGVIPVINENDTVATDEIRFGDNDQLAGHIAVLAGASKLVMLTDIDGLYTGNPLSEPSARKIEEVTEMTSDLLNLAGGAGSTVGTGGMKTKLLSAAIATDAGIDVVIAHSEQDDVIRQAVLGRSVGTLFHGKVDRLRSKRSWLLHATRSKGAVIIDDGATKALTLQSGSLLMPGVVDITGTFTAGDVIHLTTAAGIPVAKGIVNFSSSEMADLLAARAAGQRLNHLDEVVHRNDMTLLGGHMA